jgi:hypothetical protein
MKKIILAEDDLFLVLIHISSFFDKIKKTEKKLWR